MRIRVVVAAIVVVALGAWAVRGRVVPAEVDELPAVAAALRDGDDPFFGRALLDVLLQERATVGADERLRAIDLDVRLYAHQLRLGETDAAIATIERATAAARSEPTLQGRMREFHRWRGLAWLRLAEQDNCIARHAPQCCIWPLQGAGLHRESTPASRAVAAFLDCLAQAPEDPGVRWLLHVAATACGRESVVPPAMRWPDEPAPRSPRFVDRAADLGVDAFDLCGGAAVVDVDGDGFLDLVATTWDPAGPMHLFRNRGDGSFEDTTAAAGLQDQLGGLNVQGVDYDGDGDTDLLVLRGAWLQDRGCIRNSLLQNDGSGRFVDVTAAAGLLRPRRPTQTAAWGDFDGDGDLDLYVGNESRHELGPASGEYPNQLFRNDDGVFADIAALAGVTDDRYCKGVCVGDYDNDGDLDLYCSNVGANRLYRNDGDMHFTDVAVDLGVTEPSGRSFACWFFDYDNDGWLDLFVAGYDAELSEVAADMLRRHGERLPPGGSQPRLYHNTGGRFEDVTARVGLDRVTLPMGANFGDFDADGWLDVYLATGAPGYDVLIPNLLLRNDRGRCFDDATAASGLGHLQKGHGVAFADLDHDGDQDLWLQLGGFYPADAYYDALFENTGGGRLLVLELRGSRRNLDAIGARVRVDLDTPTGPRSLHRAVGCVSSFGGSTLRQEIGLGDATAVDRVVVRWPGGLEQQFVGLPLGGHVGLVEGEPAPVPLRRPLLRLGR